MEYNNEGKGALWLADKQTRDGDNYYNGSITINGKEYKLTMFINKSDNPKAPKFRLKINNFEKEETKTPSDFEKTNLEDEPFKEFGDTVEIADEDLAF